MFKMPNKADQQKMIKNYQLLQATQEKVISSASTRSLTGA